MSGEAGGGRLPADPTERVELLLRDLRVQGTGLDSREAARRLVQYGPNRLERRGSSPWPRQLARQFTHPLALLLWAAAALAWVAGIAPIAAAVVVVIVLNAAFAFVQEVQAERAVEALAEYLPPRALVIRDGRHREIDATELVPGDVIVLEEGVRVSADARLLKGSLELEMSALTGESAPVIRSAEATDTHVPLLEARELVFSGTACVSGRAEAVVFATGMQTEIGRIAALSERVEPEPSPLELQIRRVAWLIAAVAVGMGIAFVPLAMVGANLPLDQAVVFAIGLLVGNVPEGLLPVITLALAVSVRELAKRGAVVKRLSAVETLGSTTVICTDKTGTLTEDRMRTTEILQAGRDLLADGDGSGRSEGAAALAAALCACSNARLDPGSPFGDATELAMLEAAVRLGGDPDAAGRERRRVTQFPFDPVLKRMSTIERRDSRVWVDTKGAPETVLGLCGAIVTPDGAERPIDGSIRESLALDVDRLAARGLRVLAVAARPVAESEPVAAMSREGAERDLVLLGLVAMADPPREAVPDAVAACRRAGIRVIVVTGDHGLTATAVARRIGLAGADPRVITGSELESMDETALDRVLAGGEQLIFSRSSPEAKLRIADALRAQGEVVAMTGDGANDAPALRRADIGVAMGRTGTDVAREAATMILVDDDFATVVAAIRAGRRVFDNVRKFVFYIFAHLTPEIVPFLVFALAGGLVPLPLPILQLLAFDVGTETLPALALGREPAEPGLMARPPRPKGKGVVDRPMLMRAWLFVGLISAALEMGAFFWMLDRHGWSLGAPTGAGSQLNGGYRQATTMTLVAMIFCQIGTAFAARTDRVSLRSIGFLTNRLLLWGIAFELTLAVAIVYLPPLQELLGTAALPAAGWLVVAPFPVIVWGADELRRWLARRRSAPAPEL